MIILLSGHDEKTINLNFLQLKTYILNSEYNMHDIIYTNNIRQDFGLPMHAALHINSREEFISIDKIECHKRPTKKTKSILLYPGQGILNKDFIQKLPEDLKSHASSVIFENYYKIDLAAIISDEDKIKDTYFQQCLLYYFIFLTVKKLNGQLYPDYIHGHSLGEILGGLISSEFNLMFNFLHSRGLLMKEKTPEKKNDRHL